MDINEKTMNYLAENTILNRYQSNFVRTVQQILQSHI